MDFSDLTLDTTLFAQAFVTILVIMDPVGNVPIFLALTKDLDRAGKRRAAWQATGVAAGVTLAFAALGEQLLGVLGISLEALQVAGGLLLALIAVQLLYPRPAEAEAEAARGRNVALVPLGTPLLAGPGAIAATMLYMQRAETLGGLLSVVAALLLVFAVVWLALRYCVVLVRVLRENGIELLTRVLGFLLAAIAVQLAASAIDTWVRTGVA